MTEKAVNVAAIEQVVMLAIFGEPPPEDAISLDEAWELAKKREPAISKEATSMRLRRAVSRGELHSRVYHTRVGQPTTYYWQPKPGEARPASSRRGKAER